MRLFAGAGVGLLLAGVVCHGVQAQPRYLVSFDDLKRGLARAVERSGGDVQSGTYHFVVLLNTVRTSGPRSQAIRDLYHGLLYRFLVGDTRWADWISFSPFELDVWGKSVWNQRFRPKDADELFVLVPKRPQVRVDSDGGHDQEQAVLSALKHVRAKESTVIIVLSDTESSDPPISPVGYVLSKNSTFQQELKNDGFALAGSGRIYGRSARNNQPVSFCVFYAVYAYHKLRPLDTLTDTTRDKILQIQMGQPRFPKQTKPIADKRQEVGAGANWAMISLAGVVIAVVLVLVWYWSFLNKPRFVMIDGVQGTVHYGRPVYVGGPADDARCIRPPQLSGNQRVALLEVKANGSVTIRGYGPYQVGSVASKNVVALSDTEKGLSFKNTQDGSFLQLRCRTIPN